MMSAGDKPIRSADFGNNFAWGAATSAFQIEGAWNVDGRIESIWDQFTQKKRKIKNFENAQTACDNYHLYNNDIELVKGMHMNAYRFSLSWGRIMSDPLNPDPHKSINRKGIDHYNRLIDKLLAKKITPFVTLYHWDLPQLLEDKGGWTNRDIMHWFSNYTQVCARFFSDRVKNWIILNEPMVFVTLGYLLGVHAPGKHRLKHFLAATHHALLAQGYAASTLRSFASDAHICCCISTDSAYPYKDQGRHIAAARRYDAFMNRLFVDPIFASGYPDRDLPVLRKLEKYIQKDDMNIIRFGFDFLGINNYTSHRVKSARYIPWLGARPLAFQKDSPRTAMNWEIWPDGLYQQLMRFGNDPKIPPIYITENGIALHDQLEDGRVRDGRRIEFYKNHLREVRRAQQNGVDIRGYFAWSLLDNFEWAEGYHPRFGLHYVDFATLKRYPKESAFWWRDFISGICEIES